MSKRILMTSLCVLTFAFFAAPGRIKTVDAVDEAVTEKHIVIDARNYGVDLKKTDVQSVIESYERLMHRYISESDKNYYLISADIEQVMQKLQTIEQKLDKLLPAEEKTDPNKN